MDIWFSSDHHFYHRNVILYCRRPYAPEWEFTSKKISDESVTRMNEDLVERWNKVVKPNDIVHYLGDFSFSFRAAEVFAKRLNGNIHLIAGNHDKCHPVHFKNKEAKGQGIRKQYFEYGFKSIAVDGEIQVAATKCLVHHMPYADPNDPDQRYPQYRPINKGQWLLCGHVHEKWKQKDRMINVGVDQWDYTPVHIDTIAELISR